MSGFWTDPIQLFGFLIIILTLVIQLLLGVVVFRHYMRDKITWKLNISATFLFWSIALLFLALERIITPFSVNAYIGALLSISALISSVFAIIHLCLFSFNVVFPQNKMKLRMFCSILGLILIITIIISIKDLTIISPTETEFPFYLDIILMLTGLPLFATPALLLFYYSIRTRESSLPHSRRSMWLAIAILIMIITYLPEIFTYVNILRIFYTIATVIFYFCFTRFQELDWPQKIHQLYFILPEKGISLYDYSFVQEEMFESHFFASTLSGFFSMIQKFIHSEKKLKVLDHEDIKIIMEHGEKVVGVLITEENYRILRKKLILVVQAFEKHFKDELVNFTGTMKTFSAAREVVEKIFAYTEPQ